MWLHLLSPDMSPGAGLLAQRWTTRNGGPHSQIMFKAHNHCLKWKAFKTRVGWRTCGLKVESVCACMHVCLLVFMCASIRCTFADELSAASPPSQLPRCALYRGQYKMSSVTDAPFTKSTTPDLSYKKARSVWKLNNIKSPFGATVNGSHYRTIGFLVQ